MYGCMYGCMNVWMYGCKYGMGVCMARGIKRIQQSIHQGLVDQAALSETKTIRNKLSMLAGMALQLISRQPHPPSRSQNADRGSTRNADPP